MIEMLVYVKKSDIEVFRQLERILLKHPAWAQCELYLTHELNQLKDWANKFALVDILVCDVTNEECINVLTKIRSCHAETRIIPIADGTIVPSAYVRPDILPCSLYLKPLKITVISDSLIKMIEEITKVTDKSTDFHFSLRTKHENRYIPYSEIIYFEAREKKIFIRLKYQEICFYSTLSGIERIIPDSFVRCHKSFIVNTLHIRSVDWTNKLMQLSDGESIPLSRTYRKNIKEDLVNEGNI